VASSEHTVDVVSSDRHTVKPWFAGRIDYAPPVYDLTADGFPLLGGRLDVFDGRKVSVLVYRRNQHKVALTLLPVPSGNSVPVSVTQRDGFVLGQWRRGGFEMRAVSDISPAEMESFASALDAPSMPIARAPSLQREAQQRTGTARAGGDARRRQASRSSSATIASPISWVPTFLTPWALPTSRSPVR